MAFMNSMTRLLLVKNDDITQMDVIFLLKSRETLTICNLVHSEQEEQN